MAEFYDRNDTRTTRSREVAIFRDFKAIISLTKLHATSIRRMTRSVETARIKKLEDLACIPIHRSTASAPGAEESLYKGYLASNPAYMRHLLLNTAAGQTRDWWNAGRAMHAAGFVKGDIILNCASYHMAMEGHMVDAGAQQISCPTIPAGPDNLDWQLNSIAQLHPVAFCGEPNVLRRLLEAADATNVDITSIKKALVFGAPVSAHFRQMVEARGIRLRYAYTAPEFGVIAYETSAPDGAANEGMIVNEGLVVEIVKPGTNTPAAVGEVGEVVVTRLNADYPLLRYSTGDLSRVVPGASPCGRTNLRIQGWMGRIDEIALLGNKVICPSFVIEMHERHPFAPRMRLVLSVREHKDEITLRVEASKNDPQLQSKLKLTMKEILGFEARIDVVAPGSLQRDGKLISDERARA